MNENVAAKELRESIYDIFFCYSMVPLGVMIKIRTITCFSLFVIY